MKKLQIGHVFITIFLLSIGMDYCAHRERVAEIFFVIYDWRISE